MTSSGSTSSGRTRSDRPGARLRAAGRRRLPWLSVALLAAALFAAVETALLVWVGRHITVFGVFGILVAQALAGAFVVRRQGRRARRAFDATLRGAADRPGADDLGDAGLIVAGGALLMVPSLLTDLLAVFALLPPARTPVRRLVGWWGRRISMRLGLPADLLAGFGGPGGPTGHDPNTIEGEVVDLAGPGEPGPGRPIPPRVIGR